MNSIEGSTILVVDDDNEIREWLELDLKFSGYNVTTAEDGAEGLQKALNDNYNLIILDGANGSIRYDRLIFATGACSGKNFGTDGSIYNLLKKHNYEVSNLVPGLCPIKVKEDVNAISGIRVKGEVTAFFDDSSYSEKGEILFKDDGLSGIVIFNVSSIAFLTSLDNEPSGATE